MRKVAVCVMSRANYGRLFSVIQNIQSNPNLELQLILGASFYNAEVPFPVSSRIQCLLNSDDSEGMALTTGLLLTQITHELITLKPDIVLVHGDRYEVLACAIASSYLNIPLAHTEGGEDTGCIDDKVRNAITSLADIHFPVTTVAGSKLYGKENVYVTGSPAIDLLTQYDLTNNRTEPFILVLHHPNTTSQEDVYPLIQSLRNIKINKVWVNPNVDAGNKRILKKIHKENVEFVKDLEPQEYYRLLKNCTCAVGNSSSFIKEGAFLGTPVVLVGNRQKDREHSNNVLFADNISQQIQFAIEHQIKSTIEQSTKFGNGKSGRKIADILAEVKL